MSETNRKKDFEILSEELWDKHSILIGDRIDDVEMYANTVVLTRRNFDDLIKDLFVQHGLMPTEEAILAAAQYGFRYAFDSQNDGKEVPAGNVLQWFQWYQNGDKSNEVPPSIKTECELMYAQIKAAEERLKELREICKHEKTFEGNYSWRPGAIMPATICSDCGALVNFKDNFILPPVKVNT